MTVASGGAVGNRRTVRSTPAEGGAGNPGDTWSRRVTTSDGRLPRSGHRVSAAVPTAWRRAKSKRGLDLFLEAERADVILVEGERLLARVQCQLELPLREQRPCLVQRRFELDGPPSSERLSVRSASSQAAASTAPRQLPRPGVVARSQCRACLEARMVCRGSPRSC